MTIARLARLAVLPVALLIGCASPLPRAARAPGVIESSARRPVFVVGGRVAGLRGIGLTLRNARGEEVHIRDDGMFVFNSPVDDSTAYSVNVEREPISPVQSCVVEH